jgi:hypothetical protein
MYAQQTSTNNRAKANGGGLTRADAAIIGADMTDYGVRLFDNADDIERVGQAFLDRTLPKDDWTHEAHLATCLWIVRNRAEIEPETDIPRLISSYNESLGGKNSDTEGYHETITQVYIAAVRDHLSEVPEEPLIDSVNRLLLSDRGARDWPLRTYSRDRLFSVEARRTFVTPDLI